MIYYSVYDRVSDTFSPLSPAVSKESYIRSLTSALAANPRSAYVDFFEDFEICAVCDFDENEGRCRLISDDEENFEMSVVIERVKKLLGRSVDNE